MPFIPPRHLNILRRILDEDDRRRNVWHDPGMALKEEAETANVGDQALD